MCTTAGPALPMVGMASMKPSGGRTCPSPRGCGGAVPPPPPPPPSPSPLRLSLAAGVSPAPSAGAAAMLMLRPRSCSVGWSGCSPPTAVSAAPELAPAGTAPPVATNRASTAANDATLTIRDSSHESRHGRSGARRPRRLADILLQQTLAQECACDHEVARNTHAGASAERPNTPLWCVISFPGAARHILRGTTRLG